MTRVLLAEDNLDLLENISLELELRGYEVMQASDGQAAIEILRTSVELPDIIVSDIAMPDVDGFKLLEHVRSVPMWQGIPFLFLTAFNSSNSIRISKELGADDYIVKPFHADDLVLAIESKLKRIRAFQKQAERNMDDARRTLLNMISHELRTPLTAIYGGSEMLAESMANVPDEIVHKMLGLIRRGASRLNRFTAKALALVEIDTGNLERAFDKSRQPHFVNEVVDAALSRIRQELATDERRVSINLVPNYETYRIEGLTEYLVMMVEELIRNAIAFTTDGGAISISLGHKDNMATITVSDRGPGIAESDLPRIWERFIQIDRDHYEQQGAGLGLPLVRDIAHIHQGDCVIVSKPGQGTEATLFLPITEDNGDW